MSITITTKEIIDQNVHIVLSTGEEFNFDISWATQFVPVKNNAGEWVDSNVSLLKHELDIICDRAQARADQAAADAQAAQDILKGMG